MNPTNDNSRPRYFGRRKKRSIDGVSPVPLGFRGTDNLSFRRPVSYQPPSDQVVGNFRQPEGFTAADQGAIVSNPDTTIALKSPPFKKGLFKIRKSSKVATESAAPVRPKGKLRTIGRLFLAFGAAILLTAGFLFVKGYIKSRNIFKGGTPGAPGLQENVDPSLLKVEGDGRINILILGKGGEGHTAPDLTDTIIIASIDPVHKEAALLSIPRDLYVKVPGNGSMKINAVYASAKQVTLASGKQTAALQAKAEKAGFESIEKTVSETMGIPIHYHIMIDFTGFKKAIDTVGGVDINVPSAVSEQMSIDGKPYFLNVKTGWQHFDGFRALAYSRCRHCSPRSDFDRAERQRLVILALKEKVLKAGTYANPIKISQLIDAFGDHAQTNLTIEEMLKIYDIGKGIVGDKVSSIGLADPPNNFVTTATIAGGSVVVPRAGTSNFKEIQSYIRNTLKDPFIRDENAAIIIINGTTKAGLGSAKAEELKSYAYNIIDVADAPTKNYLKTIIVNLRGAQKKYTNHYLEKRFGVTATDQLPAGINAGTADFVIIIGNE